MNNTIEINADIFYLLCDISDIEDEPLNEIIRKAIEEILNNTPRKTFHQTGY